MTFVENQREYELIRASRNDGMALELWRVGAAEGPIAEVLYSDEDRSMTFTAFEQGVPFALIERLVAKARDALTPMNEPGER